MHETRARGYFTSRFDGSPPERWATDFEEWLTDKVEKGDNKSLFDYRSKAPHPKKTQPRPNHITPLMVAVGAAGIDAPGIKIQGSWTWGDLRLGAYQFE
ncbi:MAG: hypothetical protein ABSA11_11475 [Candidatus Bathyarchaeia archaeon]|jgi:4,5-DOPA dioxygenase extradiol